jgi:RimJ/RimL family protein N-acetyltransferase
VQRVSGYVLGDGRRVNIRPIQADDGERLQAHHERLSPQSRYRRFLGTKPRLTQADTRYLAQIDGCDHFALVATAEVQGAEGPFVGVARFVRVSDHPDTAEFAIVIADDYQGNGLARELLRRLAAAATRRGIRHFRAAMLADNVAIRRLMVELAVGEVKTLRSGSILELEIELPVSVEVEVSDSGCPREIRASPAADSQAMPAAA